MVIALQLIYVDHLNMFPGIRTLGEHILAIMHSVAPPNGEDIVIGNAFQIKWSDESLDILDSCTSYNDVLRNQLGLVYPESD